ncbi:MAG: DUF2156 domain-containing protein, partial [Phycisphaerae bacterium]|nr:DUF2156 domain-containing protein [Phycisphaerae bacterium]
ARTSLGLTLAVGDKAVWLGPDDAAAVYQVRGDLMVLLHDPACAEGAMGATLNAIEAHAARRGLRPVWYLCGGGVRAALAGRGYRSFHMGAEAVVDLGAFDLEAPALAYLRRAARHARSRGIDVGVLEPPIPARVLAGAASLNDVWLASKGIGELRFSQGYPSAAYLGAFPLCVARDGCGRVVGFCNLLSAGACPEVMVDLARAQRGLAWSLAHAVWVAGALWARRAGYARFNMGMAPLMDVGAGAGATWVERLARRYASAGDGPIGERGLAQFKQMYRPNWEARYLCWRGAWRLPWVFWQTTSMVLAMSEADRRRIEAGRASLGEAG